MASHPSNLDLLFNKSLGLIGAGNMAEALVRGVLNSAAITAGNIIASDPSPERREYFAKTLETRVTASNREVAEKAGLIVLCVKPQQADAVLNEIAECIQPGRHVVVSICAGIPTARIERALPKGARVVRVMPNTPMLVGLGASCLCAGNAARDEDMAVVEALLSVASLTLRVQEPMMDAVTGLSGSGPAYLFYLVEAMVDAGVAEGFTPKEALLLARRTVLGAAKMLEETGASPAELRQRVTSPNGTTQAAIERMEAEGVKSKIASAVRRAAERSRELGRVK